MKTKIVKSLNPVVKDGLNFMMANRPELLAGGALIGLGATVYFTGKAAIDLAQYRKEYDAFVQSGVIPEKKTIIKDTAKIILPAAGSTLFTGACIVGSSVIAHRQYGVLMAAYLMSRDKMKEFESKAVALLGDGKTKEIRDEIAQERVKRMGAISSDLIVETGSGNTVCLDTMSGRLFKSDIAKIREAVNDLNEQIISDWSASLNDFYSLLGLDGIKLGYNLGWNTNNLLRVSFSSALSDRGEPILVLDYDVSPEYCLL